MTLTRNWLYGFQKFCLKWILLNALFNRCICDICANPGELDAEAIAPILHIKAVPKGQLDAGIFEEVDMQRPDPAICLLKCCENELCNVAWFTHEKCYTIVCSQIKRDACDPVNQTNPEFNSTIFIQVRSLEETEPLLKKKVDGEDNIPTKLDDILGKPVQTDTPPPHSDAPPLSTEATPLVTKTPPLPRECEFGLLSCMENEICYIPEGSKKRYGFCRCEEGYSKDVNNNCVKHEEHSTDSDKTTAKMGNELVTTLPGDGVSVRATPTMVPPTLAPVTTTSKVQLLTVSAGENRVIQLPENSVTLNAFVFPRADQDEPYTYDWTLENHPEGAESGAMEGKTTAALKLSDLIVGLYTFRVSVTGPNKFGESVVNVTVNPPARENKPPVAKITPTNLVVKIPNSAILDGSDSTDDDKIVKYLWEEIKGPLQEQIITGDKAILTLNKLAAGNYTFRLTVTDSDGATNSTKANVTAIKETDYPPKADAGSDIVIHLPVNSVILYGNRSTDDKGIVSYEWTKSSDDEHTANMQGVLTEALHLTDLQVGDYTFTLKVTDASDQVSTADVHVYVKPEQNTPPIAVTEDNIEASLPLDSMILDGSNSTDDVGVVSYLWQQEGGPTILSIDDADKSVGTANGDIKVGKYTFKLTVKDKEQLTSSANLVIIVKQVANEAPVAQAGGDVVVQLPQKLVTLDGSRSTDDHKVTDYKWTRDPKSLAAGDVLNNTDNQAVLQLSNLVAGKYVFTLTVMDTEGLSSSDRASITVKEVMDAEGLSSSDRASITVKEDPHKKEMLELLLDTSINTFTEESKTKLEGELALLLPKVEEEGDTVIDIQTIKEDSSTGKLRVQFYAMNVMRASKVYRSGVESLKILKKKLMSSSYILEFKVVKIDTTVCQNNCSGHGTCDPKTKLCVCEAFWTQNFFLSSIKEESNCDWSILYVVIVCFIIVIVVTGAIWACICCWKRRRCRFRFKSKKRHRYSLLQDEDDENENIPMKKGKIQNSSVMISDSDFSSEEETIFVNQKKTNGHLSKSNGVLKQHLKTKLKT